MNTEYRSPEILEVGKVEDLTREQPGSSNPEGENDGIVWGNFRIDEMPEAEVDCTDVEQFD